MISAYLDKYIELIFANHVYSEKFALLYIFILINSIMNQVKTAFNHL